MVGLLLLIPLGISLWYAGGWDAESFAFLWASLTAGIIGFLLKGFCPFDSNDFGTPEGFASVTLGWVLVALLGAIPFILSGAVPRVVDAVFETMSGLTTTGATIVTDIEGLPPGVLFWRSFTHWLGGMGIVALSVAVLPVLGAGGTMLFRAEVPGPTTDKLAPRIAQTAKILWYIYATLTLAEVGFLWILDMPLFDAFCHAFGTMATGGFSTKTLSIQAYGPAVQWVIVVFMFLAGVNFVFYFHLIRGRIKPFFMNSEIRLYIALLVVTTLMITFSLYLTPAEDYAGRDPGYKAGAGYDSLGKAFRDAAFQSVSIMTTTGYCTENFDVWPQICRYLLVMLMVVGACAGSTGGGMKVVRLLLAIKIAVREIRRLVRPRTVFNIKIEGTSIPDEVIGNTAGFFIIYFMVLGLGAVFMHLLGLNLETSTTSVLACMSNIGPGLAGVGAKMDYSRIPEAGKLFLSFCMLLGRLEFYSVLLLFLPLTWRR
ncbi:MAG: TrkH family potassium uptake protein [Planctomycetes bacterium]|nr:TrkH family potassium uptake protein [Planctomycetota bacterium]